MRIVIGEDQLLLREGIVRLLTEAGHDVVAAAPDATSLETLVRTLQPDLLITDIRMPPDLTNDGVRLARRLRVEFPGQPILLLSQHVEAGDALDLISTAAFGYLLKDRILDLDEFLDAVNRVAAGGSAIDPEVVRTLVTPANDDAAIRSLTAREREVLMLVAEGRSNAAIAKRLWLSGRTVETHISSIINKLGLSANDDDHRRVLAVLAFLSASGRDPVG